MKDRAFEKKYEAARKEYRYYGVDTDRALRRLRKISLSVHCWQADDVTGFEIRKTRDACVSDIRPTGDFPGKPRNIRELRRDLEKTLTLIPGRHRISLHAIYGDFGRRAVDRDEIGIEHFRSWTDWAKRLDIGLDFNATCFNHPMVRDGYTLSSVKKEVREFWIEHVRRCRRIAAFFGRELKTPCLHNLWIPDGAKDITVFRHRHRQLLRESLDRIYAQRFPASQIVDSLESKLFGIGSEYYQVGSHEFYLGYAMKNKLIPCLDLGHFHPTESVADKISGILPFFKGLVIHVSRGVRWDSDHVVILDDELENLTAEIVRADALERVYLALDFFDATLNRIAAYVIGVRALLKALLIALMMPDAGLQALEKTGNKAAFLARHESLKNLPWGAIWDYYCLKNNVPTDREWIPGL
jgi:L-rhamnose isomerase